jgi:DNA end-binding protein Ku
MVLQQLLYADEVRSLDALGIELAAVGDTELKLAKQLIDQIAATSYDPHAFVDEEKQRILAAVERKVAGQQVVSHGHVDTSTSAQVVDLVAALRASLVASPNGNRAKRKPVDSLAAVPPLRERKPARRAPQPAGAKSSKARKA